jgi:hypothetical protein
VTLAAALLLAISPVLAFAAEAEKAPALLLGDVSDGSRAVSVHRIPLYAENEDGGKGEPIKPDDTVVLPFSTKWTCGECHSYDIIKHGWHFNTMDANVPPGRPGEPWIYFDVRLGLQIPLSYRAWKGTHQPDELGLSPFKFTQIFGRDMPGGGPGEVKPQNIEDMGRRLVSGPLEINCLACHNAHYGEDMGGVSGYAVQVSRQNFRWAAAASCEFATMTGSAAEMPLTYDPFMPEGTSKSEPQITYRKDAFDADNQVLFDIVRTVSNQRCYYCHSDVYYSDSNEPTEKWSSNEDVHLKAGLTCVDCHRSGVEHDTIRGYPGESKVSTNRMAALTTCESCHLPEGLEAAEAAAQDVPQSGRLGAPIPKHIGLPPIHFEKLTCTACHSGPWPGPEPVATKTSRAHLLGTPNVNKAKEVVPHIASPVFAKEGDKIAPHKMIWPAFWATMTDDKVTPIKLEVLEKTVRDLFKDIELAANGNWPGLSKEQVASALKTLTQAVGEKAVYIAGGSLYSLNDANEVIAQAGHPAAASYLWPMAHTVRPAAQSLGVRYCTDCHSTTSPFFFGSVVADSPLETTEPIAKRMVDFEGISAPYAWAFSASFVFRPWFKVVAGGAAAILGVVLLLYGLKALGAVAKVLAEDE